MCSVCDLARTRARQAEALRNAREGWTEKDWEKYADLKQEAENEKQYSMEDE